MSVFKKLFLKKKEEAVFKLKLGGGLGQGHTLSAQEHEAASSIPKSSVEAYVPPKRKELSNEARAAATAALARVERKTPKEFNTSLSYIKAQAKRELEEERKLKDEASLSEISFNKDMNCNLACQGVFFRCPIVSDEILTKNEWKQKIKDFLYQQLEEERALTSCLIIHNCNSKEKAEECIKTLTKYLDNIVKFPEEEKYYQIRMSNRVFCEKVRYVEGAIDFILAAGFQEVDVDSEKLLIWSKENVERNYDLITLLEVLQNSEAFQLELDRNLKVLLPSQAKRVELPPDFYRFSPEEVKQEQQLKTQSIEEAQILKTKAMREREEFRALRMYKYSLVRIKFSNGLVIQGTFNVFEKLSDIFDFVRSCLQDEGLDFQLVISGEGKFSEEELGKTLLELRLVPSIVLLFDAHNESSSSHLDNNFIKEDLLLLVQSI